MEDFTDKVLDDCANAPCPDNCLAFGWDVTLPGCYSSMIYLSGKETKETLHESSTMEKVP